MTPRSSASDMQSCWDKHRCAEAILTVINLEETFQVLNVIHRLRQEQVSIGKPVNLATKRSNNNAIIIKQSKRKNTVSA
jgi:uncharacterized OB-fold protein